MNFASTDKNRVTREYLTQRWDELCAQFLPLRDADSIWRYNRRTTEDDLDQGWKLHLSATILNAPRILARIAPLLVAEKVQFKAASTLDHVLTLNAGMIHGYSQIGKILTIYSRSDDQAVYLAKRLHQLTYRFKSPSVPFDLRFRDTGNVYYRYGAFKKIELEENGLRLPALIGPVGAMVPDVREIPKPDWAADPFAAIKPSANSQKPKNNLPRSLRVVRALVQRGKGGVYQAVDLKLNPPRQCLLKEGRRHGELTWDGRDGASRVRHEELVLARLLRCGLNVPRVYSRFELQDNVYLVTEFIDGESLHSLLLRQNKRMPIKRILSFGIQIADFLARMHNLGWAWRDCKPRNLIVDSNDALVPIDFEGAERISRPNLSAWGTPGFIPRKSRAQVSCNGITDDLYALGAVLYLLVTGRMLDEQKPISTGRLRRNVPLELDRLIESLMNENSRRRPAARSAQKALTVILKNSTGSRLRLAEIRAA